MIFGVQFDQSWSFTELIRKKKKTART
jgi:hypothetical protein